MKSNIMECNTKGEISFDAYSQLFFVSTNKSLGGENLTKG
jgi:hypothetical protein